MILVTGAAGKTGKAVIKALVAAGARVRGLVRRPEQAAAIQALGAHAHVGEFEAVDSLERAAAGAAAIYYICPNVSSNELLYARNIVSAAQSQRVRRFVYHSVLHPQIEAMPHHWRKMQVEQTLFTAGFNLTILQPTAYMQNILGGWRTIVEDGIFRIPYPAATRLSLIDLADLAEAAARVFMAEGHAGATYELVGTPPLAQVEVAAAIEAALSRTIRVEVEDLEIWASRARSAGMNPDECAMLAAMFRYYASHGLNGNSNVLRWLLGREPTSLAGFLARQTVGDTPSVTR
jgi:NAD(P)H dehydrogenase (quinone)